MYKGAQYITTLTEKIWERRLVGDTVWLVKAYAAWCPACKANMAQAWRRRLPPPHTAYAGRVRAPHHAQAHSMRAPHAAASAATPPRLCPFRSQFHSAAELLRDETSIDVGAINCERAGNKRICADWLSVDAYPSLLLLNRHHGMLARYPKDDDKTAEKVRAWTLRTATEWRRLMQASAVVAIDAAEFDSAVMEDERAWVVLYTDGLTCAPCRAAKTNLMRLSASLEGLPVGVGYVDCEAPTSRALCREAGLPERPHAPEWRGYGRGAHTMRRAGEPLFNEAQIDAASALELVDRGLRLALADRANSETFDSAPREASGGPDAFGGGGGVRWDSGMPPRRDKPLPWGGPRRPDHAGGRIAG